jgi:hypothetical protein
MKVFKLSSSIQKIIIALSDTLITQPQELTITDRDAQLIKRCETLLREFPKLMRFGFLFALHAFNQLPFLFGFGTKGFCGLSLPKKRLYAKKWLNNRFNLLREAYKGFRGIVMYCYFSHHDVWDYIGYHPKQHIEGKIKLREEILKRQGHDS